MNFPINFYNRSRTINYGREHWVTYEQRTSRWHNWAEPTPCTNESPNLTNCRCESVKLPSNSCGTGFARQQTKTVSWTCSNFSVFPNMYRKPRQTNFSETQKNAVDDLRFQLVSDGRNCKRFPHTAKPAICRVRLDISTPLSRTSGMWQLTHDE